MAGSQTSGRREHHELSRAVWARQEDCVLRLKKVISSSTNPMINDKADLMNIIMKLVMLQQVTNDLCNRDDVRQHKYEEFLEQRITNNTVSVVSSNEEGAAEDVEEHTEVGQTSLQIRWLN